MSKIERVDNLSAEDLEYYTKLFARFKSPLVPTGECIRESWENGEAITKVVVKGNWTPYNMIRDCGDHYIFARYSRYDKVSKDLQRVEEDVRAR